MEPFMETVKKYRSKSQKVYGIKYQAIPSKDQNEIDRRIDIAFDLLFETVSRGHYPFKSIQ